MHIQPVQPRQKQPLQRAITAVQDFCIREKFLKYILLLLLLLGRKALQEGIEPFTKEEYDKVKREIKNGKAPDLEGWRYELIKNAGKDFDDSMLKMINTVVTNNIVPEEWTYLIIKSISKGKGDLLSMDSKRGLLI